MNEYDYFFDKDFPNSTIMPQWAIFHIACNCYSEMSIKKTIYATQKYFRFLNVKEKFKEEWSTTFTTEQLLYHLKVQLILSSILHEAHLWNRIDDLRENKGREWFRNTGFKQEQKTYYDKNGHCKSMNFSIKVS